MSKLSTLEKQILDHVKRAMAIRGRVYRPYVDADNAATYGGRTNRGAVNSISDFDLMLEIMYSFHFFDTREHFDMIRAAGMAAFNVEYYANDNADPADVTAA